MVVVAVPLGLPRVVELALVRAGGRLGVAAAGATAVVGLTLKRIGTVVCYVAFAMTGGKQILSGT